MGRTKHLATLLLSAAALFAGSAQAAYSTYFGEDTNGSPTVPLSSTPKSDAARDSFLSKLINVGTETFEGQASGASAPLPLTFKGASGDVTATLSGGGGSVKAVTPGKTDDSGRYSVPSATTSKYWNVEAGTEDSPANTFTVTFSRAIAAFGFYGIDIGDFGGQLALLLFNGNQQVGSLPVANTEVDADGSVLYFGFVAEGAGDVFTSISFVMTGTGATTDVFAFDNFTVAELAQVQPPGNVPEPATLALAGAALLAAGAVRRRRPRNR